MIALATHYEGTGSTWTTGATPICMPQRRFMAVVEDFIDAAREFLNGGGMQRLLRSLEAKRTSRHQWHPCPARAPRVIAAQSVFRPTTVRRCGFRVLCA